MQESPEVDLNSLPVQHKSENTPVTHFNVYFPHIRINQLQECFDNVF